MKGVTKTGMKGGFEVLGEESTGVEVEAEVIKGSSTSRAGGATEVERKGGQKEMVLKLRC